jgi:hypothetical protein
MQPVPLHCGYSGDGGHGFTPRPRAGLRSGSRSGTPFFSVGLYKSNPAS